MRGKCSKFLYCDNLLANVRFDRVEALDVRVRNSSAKVGNNKNLATMDGERPRVWENRVAFGGRDVPPNFWFFIRGVKTP